MVRALSVWADALQYETLCVVRLVRRADELGVVSGSCGANILFSSLSKNRTTNVRFIETCGMIKVYRWPKCLKLFCCAGISSYIIVQRSLITFAAARRRTLFKISFTLSLSSMHSIQSEIHKSFCWNTRVSTSTNVSETVQPNFLETVFSNSAQRHARTCNVIFALIERRRSTPALENNIASQVLGGRRNFKF